MHGGTLKVGVAGCVCAWVYVCGAQELPVDCSRLSGEYIEKHTYTHTVQLCILLCIAYTQDAQCAPKTMQQYFYIFTRTHASDKHTHTFLCTMHIESHSD